jgi:serine/threonine protein kinase
MEEHHNKSSDEEVTFGTAYLTCTSDSTESPANLSLADRYHHNFISFFSLVQQLQVDILETTWRPWLQPLGGGASSQVSSSDAVTTQLTFAFKRTIPRRGQILASPAATERKRFRALICEILVLQCPAVRNHPNITSLLGISWEFWRGAVWPVLAFPRASHGSLEDFISSKACENIPFETLVTICCELALALDCLHGSSTWLSWIYAHPKAAAHAWSLDIIHGDIKPGNILISYESNRYVPKVTDFESAGVFSSANDLITLRRTIPWDAPEWHDRWFTLEDAKRTDVYSFGLVCMVTLIFSRNGGTPSLQSQRRTRTLTCLPRHKHYSKLVRA